MIAHIAIYAILHLTCKGAFIAQAFLTDVCSHLGMSITILSTVIAVAPQFATYNRFIFFNSLGYHFLFKTLLVHHRNCVSLRIGKLCHLL